MFKDHGFQYTIYKWNIINLKYYLIRRILKNHFRGIALAALTKSFFIIMFSIHQTQQVQQRVSSGSGITYTSSTKILEISKSSSQGTSIGTDGAIVLIHSVDSSDVNVMLINSGGTIKAFTAVCPHQGVKTMWTYSNNQIKCSAHNSNFDSSGTFLSNSSTSGVSNLTLHRNNTYR